MGTHNFEYELDTTPMANALGNVENSVDRLNNAVVTMEGAVIEAETRAAMHVCQSVNAGFFSLIASQISQKIANVQPRVYAGGQLLMHLKKELEKIEPELEKDYNRCKKTYTVLFTQIDRSTKDHLAALDRDAFNLIDLYRRQCIEHQSDKSAFSLLMDNDVNHIRQLGLQTHVMDNAKHGIVHVSDYKDEYNLLEKKQDALASNKKVFSEEELSVPVLFMTADGIATDGQSTDIHLVSGFDCANVVRIKNKVVMDLNSREWSEISSESHELLKSDVKSMLVKNGCSDRVATLVNEMLENSNIEEVRKEL